MQELQDAVKKYQNCSETRDRISIFRLQYTALQMILSTESTRFYKLDKTCPSKHIQWN